MPIRMYCWSVFGVAMVRHIFYSAVTIVIMQAMQFLNLVLLHYCDYHYAENEPSMIAGGNWDSLSGIFTYGDFLTKNYYWSVGSPHCIIILEELIRLINMTHGSLVMGFTPVMDILGHLFVLVAFLCGVQRTGTRPGILE